MASLMEKDAMIEMVNGAIAELTKKKINDESARYALYSLNAALLRNPPEIFDFEETVKMVNALLAKYE